MAKEKMKVVIWAVLALMILSLGGITYYYWYENRHYVKTEDAYLDAALVRVSPLVSGKILELYADEGQRVEAGQAMARLDDAALPPGTNPDLTVVRAPAAGTVVKKMANEGEMAVPGQAMFMIADLDNVYLTVNVEEKKLDRVRPGQRVDFTLDGVPGRTFRGTVDSVGRATASTFSLLPSRSTSGTFIKVVQRVPVKVVFPVPQDIELTVGMSAAVRIHLKG
ncbi:MAG: efflux RND transporter periplasmic adaptor subunit [Bacillota bacterium]|nr:efflux RND transporter periplasmic adaptor subunit [Bacillota bacterium]